MDKLKAQVQSTSSDIHQALEHKYFSRTPIRQNAFNGSTRRINDTNSTDAWQQVLRHPTHHHVGLFEDHLDISDKAKIDSAHNQAVSDLYPFIPKGGRTYDIGCDWGGPTLQLTRELGCRVEGITPSQSQFRYCAAQGLQVRLGDVEETLPPGQFDCILMIDSLCYVRDKVRLLKILRLFSNKLVIRDHCQEVADTSLALDNTMFLNSARELREMLTHSDWKITHWRNRRAETMPSIYVWQQRLCPVPTGQNVHIETFRQYCDQVLTNPDDWAANNPVIEIVAE